ncbi:MULTISPECIES: nuclear transport factor 2 family protein [unclassified Bradyrhizobium]|uniref:nuclear transport factor 2 family protein n=1 Tax=unclassified Bradyrhizobium TaxID=2631580 RepID=UPI001FF740DD|nr:MULTISPECIES: nuclear transport factor 2 family protein [unclassified Bradyrhizobium]MCK1309980.1 nuclear transport factor 2 family protein [Bradyrhizobium sp. 45]MCK1433866.1 nuclear transport factor 2 family protein [Bradyrhizobium sp. 15]MCK1614990.1 nuclear transport factor 2 family protein [Bradyrhizobium sp. 163]MCK1764769.1 nuclear transport factor 2 family protein [Bradyrhizobium sp. 136]
MLWCCRSAGHRRSICRSAEEFCQGLQSQRLDAMAAAFTEDAVRVTPSGIFVGREAIRRNLQDVVNLDLHDYSVERNVSRSIGNFVFNAGEWQAKLGDQPLHGYYTAIIVRDGQEAKIMEETVTISAPGH